MNKIILITGASSGIGWAAALVANVIYEAATDESKKLRYRAGADAEHLLDSRSKMVDGEFVEMMKQQYEL